MNAAAPISPARIDLLPDGTPCAPDYGDVYHTTAGAFAQARHVFLGGNRLPGRWQGRERFVVLETGFGLGNNFLATWQAWRDDPSRCERLIFVSIEKHPPTRADLARAQGDSTLRPMAERLIEAWPPLTPDLHVLDFDGGRVRLLLLLADIADALPALTVRADAFYLDGFAPPRNPAMWDPHRLRALPRLAAPDATAATWSVAREVRDGLSQAGFVVTKAPGFGGKPDMTVARFAPRFVPPAPAGRQPQAAGPGRVAVIGAGLAGSAVARALGAAGTAVDVFDAAAHAAAAASGNPAGLFHGIVHAHDGAHARWLRAAARRTQQHCATAFGQTQLPGAFGLIRGESQLSLAAMQALVAAQALPPDWVQPWDATTCAQRGGLLLRGPGWFYPGGGWLDPAALVRGWLQHPGITLHTASRVDRLQRQGSTWLLMLGDRQHRVDTVVLANAADAMRLLGEPRWPWQTVRGQLSIWPRDTLSPQALQLPLADNGYALRLPDGRVLSGATSHADDTEPGLRLADHATNLATLQRLAGGITAVASEPAAPDGRVAWRQQTGDRLPLVGAVPLLGGSPAEDQPRRIAREPGLWIAAGFGSRGITHATLAGEVLAAWLMGDPLPLPSELLDAIDPARFAARLNRKSAS